MPDFNQMQTAYQNLAEIYDILQHDLDIGAWAAYIRQIDKLLSRRRGTGDGRDGMPILVDLGCGTGTFCQEMAKHGYDPIGIDASSNMLDQARKRNQGTCLFLQQDISRFELFGTADLIVCLLDTINHLIRPEQAARLLSLCANYLNPGGLFVFDAASRIHLEKTLGSKCFYEDTDDYTLLWQSRFRPQSGISCSEILFFSRQQDGNYQRSETTIFERYYSSQQIRSWIFGAGLELAARPGQLDMKPPASLAERQFYIARKPLKERVKQAKQ